MELQSRNAIAFCIITGASYGTVRAGVKVAAHEQPVMRQLWHSPQKVMSTTSDDYGGKEKKFF